MPELVKQSSPDKVNTQLTDKDRDLIGKVFSNPLLVPKVFKSWLVNFLEGSEFQLTASQISGSVLGGGIPVGGMCEYAGSSDPTDTNFVIADGRQLSRTNYATLFQNIGIAHGAGDGSTTFNIPNAQRRVVVGYLAGDPDFGTFGATAGLTTHALTTDEMPVHAHDVTEPTASDGSRGHIHGITDVQHHHAIIDGQGGSGFTTFSLATGSSFGAPGGTGDRFVVDIANTESAFTGITGTGRATTGVTIADKGGGAAHTNLQPHIVLNKLIRVL